MTKETIKESFRRFLFNISPKLNVWYGIAIHRSYYRHFLSFKHPVTMDEKLNVMKLERYKYDPIYTQCADKYAVRQFVQDMGCGEILNELYFVWNDVDEIDWDLLPDSFVIKWNFGCGQNLIVRDKSKLDKAAAEKQLRSWKRLHKTGYKAYAEMQYKNIEPKLICEKLIETEDGGAPVDYKVYCFNGKPYVVLLCFGRGASTHPMFYFVDKDWELKRLNQTGRDAPEGFSLPQPEGSDKLFEYAEKLARPFAFVRADFYLEKGKVTFGELTFTPGGAIDYHRLYDTNRVFGDMIDMNYKPVY